jgi:hypothetical protein
MGGQKWPPDVNPDVFRPCASFWRPLLLAMVSATPRRAQDSLLDLSIQRRLFDVVVLGHTAE